MPRPNKIRWKPSEKEQLRKEIKRFNDRRRKAVKKNPALINFLPTISYKEVLKSITTRNDYNRILKELNWSRAKNAFRLVKIGDTSTTKWQLRKSKAQLRTVNRKRDKERKNADVSTEKGTMGTIYQNNLNRKKMSNPQNQTEWQKFMESLEKQVRDDYDDSKARLYRDNYLRAYQQVFGFYRYRDLESILSSLQPIQVARAMYENPILNLSFLYVESEDINILNEHADAIIITWSHYAHNI